MAIQKNIKINVDTGQAVKDVDKLDDSFKNLDNQTEKTSSSLKDVGENGGAIAILDSLTGGLATRVRDAYEATKLFNFSLKGTSKALIATGVGAFVVALGVIVAYWDDITEAISGANKELVELNKTAYETVRAFDAVSASWVSAIEFDGLIDASTSLAVLRNEFKDLDNVLKTLEKNGDDTKERVDEIVSAYRDYLVVQADIKIATEKLQKLDSDDSSFNIKTKQLNSEIFQLRLKKLELQNIFDIEEKEKKEDKEVFEKRKTESIDNGLKPDDAITLDSKKLLAEKTAEINDKVTKDILTSEAAILNAKRITRDYEIQYRQQVKDASIQLASSTLNALVALAEEGSALSKGVAVAQAIMSTYQGVNAALAQTTDPTPTQTLRFANAAAVGIAGLLNVKKILETQPISKTSPNISGGRGSAPAAPSFNLVEGTQENQIANSLNNREPIQSFVVATAVTSSQELNRNAESNGSL